MKCLRYLDKIKEHTDSSIETVVFICFQTLDSSLDKHQYNFHRVKHNEINYGQVKHSANTVYQEHTLFRGLRGEKWRKTKSGQYLTQNWFRGTHVSLSTLQKKKFFPQFQRFRNLLRNPHAQQFFFVVHFICDLLWLGSWQQRTHISFILSYNENKNISLLTWRPNLEDHPNTWHELLPVI